MTSTTSHSLPERLGASGATLLRDLRYAGRALVRAPLAALTIVTTLGLGLGLVAVVFTILNAVVFRSDAVHAPEQLYAIERPSSDPAMSAGLAREDFDVLARETTLFSDVAASTSDVQALIEGTRREGRLVTGNFFEVLGAGAVRGRALTPADDRPGGAPVLVLSHRAWSQHFASDPSVVGRTVRVNDATVEIVGVMPELFRGLEVIAAPDFWAPLALQGRFDLGTGEAPAGLRIVGRLAPGTSEDEALAQLRTWDARRTVDTERERASRLALVPARGTVPLTTGVLLSFMPLFFAFGLILMIGCANVANLLLARGFARQREIGIRLSIGASRRRVVLQLLNESLLLALVSAAFAFGISRLVLERVVHTVNNTFPPEIGNLRLAVPAADWRVAVFLVAGAAVSTLCFALAPALRATRLDPVRAMRGDVVGDGRPGGARNALVIAQVTGSVLLLICAAVFLRSIWATTDAEPGIRTTGIVTVDVVDESQRATILATVAAEPLVAAVSASTPAALGGAPAFAEGLDGRSAVTYQLVSPAHFDVLDIDLVRGRGFLETETSAEAAVAIVSASVADTLWPNQEPLGRVFSLESNVTSIPQAERDRLAARRFAVVGVAEDVAGFRFGEFELAGAGVYVPTAPQAAATALVLRVRGDADAARLALNERLAAVDPNMAQLSTLQTLARAEAYLLSIPLWLSLALGMLALFLTVAGIYSVLSYVVVQRTKEIGVRTALGATRARIGGLVLTQSARPIGVGVVFGGMLAAGLGAALLAIPAAAPIGSIVPLFDPAAYAGAIVCVVVACVGAALVPALRAAHVDPIGALRKD